MKVAKFILLVIWTLPTLVKGALEVQQNEVDFGAIELTGSSEDRNILSHVFLLRNTGPAPIAIKEVKASCSCTKHVLSKKELLPGEETSLDASLSLEGRMGAVSGQLAIVLADNSIHLVEMKARVARNAAIVPGSPSVAGFDGVPLAGKFVVYLSSKSGIKFDPNFSFTCPEGVEIEITKRIKADEQTETDVSAFEATYHISPTIPSCSLRLQLKSGDRILREIPVTVERWPARQLIISEILSYQDSAKPDREVSLELRHQTSLEGMSLFVEGVDTPFSIKKLSKERSLITFSVFSSAPGQIEVATGALAWPETRLDFKVITVQGSLR